MTVARSQDLESTVRFKSVPPTADAVVKGAGIRNRGFLYKGNAAGVETCLEMCVSRFGVEVSSGRAKEPTLNNGALKMNKVMPALPCLALACAKETRAGGP